MPSGTRTRIPSVGQDHLILPVREQVLPNYSLCSTRAIAGDRPPRYGKKDDLPRQEVLILEILEILEILLQAIKIAGDRPPRYELRTFEASRLGGRADRKKSRPGGLSYQEGIEI